MQSFTKDNPEKELFAKAEVLKWSLILLKPNNQMIGLSGKIISAKVRIPNCLLIYLNFYPSK
jgi:hypothetical protein